MNGPARHHGGRGGGRLRDHARRWINRRQRDDGLQAYLGYDRIYLLPTRTGYLLFAMILLMLLGATNYANNLAFLMTFLLIGIAHNSLFYTYRNLFRLRVSARPVPPVFAGQTIHLPLRITAIDARPHEALELKTHPAPSVIHKTHVEAGRDHDVTLTLPPAPRGLYYPPRIRLSSRFPLGLLEAWSWLNLRPEILVYPRPVDPGPGCTGPAAPDDATRDAIRRTRSLRDEQDPDTIRPYRPGDPPGRIVWKAYARTGRLHTRESTPAQPAGNTLWLDWEAMPGRDGEQRLSMLCHAILTAHADDRIWGLRLPGHVLEPNRGNAHRDRGLEALARHDVKVRILPDHTAA